MHAVALIDARLETQLHEMMTELHELVSRLQLPRLKGDAWREQTLARCQELTQRITEILEQLRAMAREAEEQISERLHEWRDHYAQSWDTHRAELHRNLETVAERLRVYSAELSARANKQTLKDVYQTLQVGYEELVNEISQLRQEGLISTARASHLKPVNYARNIFHAMMGITAAVMYQFVLTRNESMVVLITLMSVFGFLEITRRFSTRWNDFLVDTVFGWIARPHERTKTNGSTWYVIALVLILFLYPKPVVLAAVLTLALADPAASVAGKLWGKKKIIAGKSYVGSLAFLLVAFAVCFPFAVSYHGFLFAFPVALIVAFVTMLAELLITKVDDNFTIPVTCATVAWMLF